ncbi:O-antigen ligase family protein [Micromonospora sp. R77]|uniref:O-antigen ligase family protein n=1 Tax=Micromonospora sp. R77 TaxID=2925836 RepID=UPI001F60349E|nr:O-antigen ligase family protein [Micromonospora sp. R77]MCI4065254.1 O-antigen ligase family protein [Micromonospora sp. R77]
MAVAYVASVPFDGLPLNGRSVPFLVGAVLIPIVLLDLMRPKRVPLSGSTAATLAVCLFVGYATASYFWAFDPDTVIARLPGMFILAVVTLLLPGYLRPVWRIALWGYCASATILAVAVLMAPADAYAQRRTASGNANDVATFLGIAVVLALYLALTTSRGRACLALLLAVPNTVGLVATGSRTGLIALIVGTVLVVVQALWRQRGGAAARLPVLAGAGILVSLFLSTQYVPPRLLKVVDSLEEGSLSGREIIWNAVLSDGFTLRGVGLGGSPSYLEAVHGIRAVTHNVLIELLLELGLLGVLLFAVLVVTVAVRCRRSVFAPVLLPLVAFVGLMSTTLSLEWRRALWLVFAFALTATSSVRAAHRERR